MRRKAWLHVLALVALVLAAPPAGAAPSGAHQTALTGTVVISGSASGYVPVTVAKEMLLPDPFVDATRDAVTITGGGRTSGFALVQDGLEGPALIGGRTKFTEAATQERGVFVGDPGGSRRGAEFVLPPGRYKLYLATDGKPTTVTLKFRGGSGRTILKPTVETREVVQAGPPTVNMPGLYTAGFDTPAGPSVHFSVAAFETSVHTESVFTRCYFLVEPQGPNPYLPGCPSTEPRTGLSAVQPVSDENVGEGRYLYSLFAINFVGGHFGSGGSWTNGSVLTGSDYSHFFLDLAPSTTKANPVKPAGTTPELPKQPSPNAPVTVSAVAADSGTLPATGLPGPALVAAPALLLAAAAARHTRNPRG